MKTQDSSVQALSCRTPLAVGASDLTCEICGAQMVQRQCKISCPNCGFTRDCSDP